MSSIKKINDDFLTDGGWEMSVRGKYFQYQFEHSDGKVIEFDCRLSKGAMYNLLKKSGIDGFLKDSLVSTGSSESIDLDDYQSEEEADDIFADFATLDAYIEMCMSNSDDFKNINSILVSGVSGISKTHHIEKALEDRKIEYFHIKGYSTAYSLFEILKMNPEGVFVFDDCDSIWEDVKGLNILKSALETTKDGIRKITYAANGEVEILEFKGTIFFISNMDFFKKGGNREKHINAVLGRTMTVAITSKREEVLKYIISEASNVSADKKAVDMAVVWMEEKTKVRPDFRYFMKLIALAKFIHYDQEKFDLMAKAPSKIQSLAG